MRCGEHYHMPNVTSVKELLSDRINPHTYTHTDTICDVGWLAHTYYNLTHIHPGPAILINTHFEL